MESALDGIEGVSKFFGCRSNQKAYLIPEKTSFYELKTKNNENYLFIKGQVLGSSEENTACISCQKSILQVQQYAKICPESKCFVCRACFDKEEEHRTDYFCPHLDGSSISREKMILNKMGQMIAFWKGEEETKEIIYNGEKPWTGAILSPEERFCLEKETVSLDSLFFLLEETRLDVSEGVIITPDAKINMLYPLKRLKSKYGNERERSKARNTIKNLKRIGKKFLECKYTSLELEEERVGLLSYLKFPEKLEMNKIVVKMSEDWADIKERILPLPREMSFLHLEKQGLSYFKNIHQEGKRGFKLLFLGTDKKEDVLDLLEKEAIRIRAFKGSEFYFENYAALLLGTIDFSEDCEMEVFSIVTQAVGISEDFPYHSLKTRIKSVRSLIVNGEVSGFLKRIILEDSIKMEILTLSYDRKEKEIEQRWIDIIKNTKEVWLKRLAIEIICQIGEGCRAERLYLEDDMPPTIQGWDFRGEVKEEGTVCLGGVKMLSLVDRGAMFLQRLHGSKLGNTEKIAVDIRTERQALALSWIRRESVELGFVKKLMLSKYGCLALEKIKLKDKKCIEELWISCSSPEENGRLKRRGFESIETGFIESIELKGYAVDILLYLRIPQGNVLKSLLITCDEVSMLGELRNANDEVISLGEVKKIEIKPERGIIRRKIMKGNKGFWFMAKRRAMIRLQKIAFYSLYIPREIADGAKRAGLIKKTHSHFFI
eukprot:GHVN01061499.1.p1 GENE.GHVN01061499.1~~GHVN01061499.1.p1  ORF type:complete len:716 (+),score=65.28 GHVN01061499.1:3-2150(+)